MKNTSFARRWTKTSVGRILDEYKNSDEYFICRASREFKELWKDHHNKITDLAKSFYPDYFYDDGVYDVLFPKRSDIQTHGRREIRLMWLEHEHKRLCNLKKS